MMSEHAYVLSETLKLNVVCDIVLYLVFFILDTSSSSQRFSSLTGHPIYLEFFY